MVINKSGVGGTEAASETQRPKLCQKLSTTKAFMSEVLTGPHRFAQGVLSC